MYCSHCFKSLGVDTRSKIYFFLKEQGKCSVNQIVSKVDLTQPTVSYHLKEMESVGLLQSEKKGKQVFYSINKECPVSHKECVLSSVEFPQKNDEYIRN